MDPRIKVGNWEIVLDPETQDLQITSIVGDRIIVLPDCANKITVRMVNFMDLRKLRPTVCRRVRRKLSEVLE